MKYNKRNKNKCVLLRRRCIKDCFSEIRKNDLVTNKNFWKTIKSF